MEEASRRLIETNDFVRLEKLGRHATHAQPFANWEGILIGAYLGQGKYDVAQEYYESIVPVYTSNIGVNPTNDMLALADRLGLRSRNHFSGLDEIMSDLRISELTGLELSSEGGLICIFPVLCGVYQLVERLRTEGSYLMLCTFTSKTDAVENAAAMVIDYTPILKQAVRNIDVVCHYGASQYLILFTSGMTEEGCAAVQEQIRSEACKDRESLEIIFDLRKIEPEE